MEAAIDRIMQTYDLLVNRSAAASAEARAKVTEYVTTLFEAGEKDTASPHRVRADLFARARRLKRSGEGGVYRTVRSSAVARREPTGRAFARPVGSLRATLLAHIPLSHPRKRVSSTPRLLD